MATVAEWEKYLAQLDTTELQILKGLILHLKLYTMFVAEFSELGLFELVHSIDYVLTKRTAIEGG